MPRATDAPGGADLDAIEALAAAATAGPWLAWQRGMTPTGRGRREFPDGFDPAYNPWTVRTAYDHPQLAGPDEITRLGRHIFQEPEYTPCLRREDAAFIAAAREAVPALTAEVRRLRAELAAARPVVALIERAATETYMGADEELLLMAKGRAFDRLIAAWDRLDHARALAARDGQGGGSDADHA